MNELLGQQKRRQLLAMLDRGLVMLHLDPRREGVVVPPQFQDDPVLRLNIAYGFNLPALDIDGEGVFAILSFNRHNFACTLPWDAVFAITAPDDGHEGVVWPESIPGELAPFFESIGVTRGAVPVSLRAGPAPRDEGAPVVPVDAVDGELDAPPPPRTAPRRPASAPFLVVHDGGRDDDASEPDDGEASSDEVRPTLTVVDD